MTHQSKYYKHRIVESTGYLGFFPDGRYSCYLINNGMLKKFIFFQLKVWNVSDKYLSVQVTLGIHFLVRFGVYNEKDVK